MTTTTPIKTNKSAESGGFLAPHKPGQGFWTRLGTGIGAGLVILFLVNFLYNRLPSVAGLSKAEWPLYLVLAGLTLVLVLIAWWLINRPRHADFLINTDGEMKKVNWATRRELIGSTKVVIGFMFLTAAVLFGYDLIFGSVMYMIDVLKVAPPFFGGDA
jgi:preprotein translocase subunit SecE